MSKLEVADISGDFGPGWQQRSVISSGDRDSFWLISVFTLLCYSVGVVSSAQIGAYSSTGSPRKVVCEVRSLMPTAEVNNLNRSCIHFCGAISIPGAIG